MFKRIINFFTNKETTSTIEAPYKIEPTEDAFSPPPITNWPFPTQMPNVKTAPKKKHKPKVKKSVVKK
tara:strand:+ start:121 stop:324 length:204 start_codon:yes stop_codon:yes gene_type:complete